VLTLPALGQWYFAASIPPGAIANSILDHTAFRGVVRGRGNTLETPPALK